METEHKMNDEQEIVYNEILHAVSQGEYLKNLFYLLDAPGGTGKTFVIKKLCERVYTCVLAPTNKVKNLLAEYNANTIISFFKGRSRIRSDGEKYFELRMANNCDYETNRAYKLIIVDECSMVSEEQVILFQKFAYKYRIPILFVGDEYQIPPINETKSVIYDLDLVRFTLKTNHRLTSNIPVIQKLRSRINPATGKAKSTFRCPPRITPQEVIKSFEDVLKNQVILAYTKERVKEWNDIIRKKLYGNNVGPVVNDEHLVFSGHRRIDENLCYKTSDTVIVHDLEDIVDWVEVYPRCACPEARNTLRKYFDNTCHVCKKPLCYKINFLRFSDQHGTEWRIIENEGDKKIVTQVLKAHEEYIISLRDELVIDGMSEKKIEAKLELEWRAYHDKADLLLSQLDYRYASTVHKAQGSEWSCVFVDYKNIIRSPIVSPRLLYTAASRVRDELQFI